MRVRVSVYQPLALLLLLVLPAGALLSWWLLRRRPMRYAVRFTNVEVLAAVVDRRARWRWLLPGMLFVLALVSASVAVARPYRRALVPFERRIVVLVVDVSGSMGATDIRPTRIGAAQQAARAFLARLPRSARVGVVAFSFEPDLVAPPSSDRRLVERAIDSLTPFGSTAIGDALAAALNLGEHAAQPGVSPAGERSGRGLVSIVLLSDGRNNSGQLQPLQAARQARADGVPVYTVALGSPRGGYLFSDTGLIPIGPPDTRTLHAIATTTGGKFTNATNATTLRRAYTQLGTRLGWRRGREEISSLFLGASALFLIAAGALGALWSPRLP